MEKTGPWTPCRSLGERIVGGPWWWCWGGDEGGKRGSHSVHSVQGGSLPGTPNNHVSPTISYVKIGNHPIETTIYKWLFGVPGTSYTWGYFTTVNARKFSWVCRNLLFISPLFQWSYCTLPTYNWWRGPPCISLSMDAPPWRGAHLAPQREARR